MRVEAEPLATCSELPLKLSRISPTLTTNHTTRGNQGTSTKTPFIAPCTNLYGRAPSGKSGYPVLSASRNTPRQLVPLPDTMAPRCRPFTHILKITHLERHPFTSQSFVPMGGALGHTAYVVVVADGESEPVLEHCRAFVVDGNEGVCYDAGLWHAPMAVIGRTTDFSIFQHMNHVPNEDCETQELLEPLQVILCLGQS